MAIDGSFVLQYEFDRFLARCPKLQCLPRLQSLSQKGDSVTEEEVVNSLAELFLHPNYTVPLMGCFRPIARKILDRAVALLRLVPSLKFDSEDAVTGIGKKGHTIETGNTDVEDDVDVIDFCVRSGRGLKLHELASLAFCRALDLAPFLLGGVLNYFKFAPPPFQRLLATDSTSLLIEKGGTHLLNAVRTSFRFLLIKPKVFSELWNWSCFLNLVQHSLSVGSGNNPELLKAILDIKWCGIQILSIVLRMSDRATSCFGLDAENSLSCLLRWDQFCQDVSVEKASWYLERTEHHKGDFVDGSIDFDQEYCLQSFGLLCSEGSSLEPLSRNRRLSTWGKKSADGPFVLTSAVKKSFEMVLLGVSQKWPVLLYGPTGSGKTALISKLAQVSGNQVLFIHMDEHMDGKTLIGSYVCTEIPGEFRWQPGSLTQAVQHGLWVVFEDIDKAPSDVQSILLPLLEGSSSFVAGHGEAISVSESFRLFSTVSISKHDTSHNSEGRISLGVLWRRVMIGPSSNKDLLDIVNVWYPNLEAIAEKLIETFEMVNGAPSQRRGGFQFGNPASGRFSLRDLLKWCKRITGLGFSFVGPRLSAHECKSIYKEAVDIFASSSASFENRLLMKKEIAQIWEVPITEADRLYPLNKPIIQDLQSELQVGRIALKCTQLHFQKRPFVDIRSSLHVLEKIACSVKFNEPVLLVGETGTGKTTLVQNLAMRLGRSLTVLNLSQQSDVADLLGGFKPTDARLVCIPLYNEFQELFSRTFSAKENEDYLVRLGKHIADKNWKIVLNGFQKALNVFKKQVYEVGGSGCGTKRKRPLSEVLSKAWESFSTKLDSARRQIGASTCMAFSFVEGAFVTALRNGHWILLDEVNLAPPETLQRIIGVLEGEQGSFCLAERGDVNYIDRHPDFRIFACMNPATDAGKRDLPYSLRSRFTEYFVDDVLDDEDLSLFVKQFIDEHRPNRELVNKIVQFYKVAKKESEERLQDGASQKPQYSLRSLYRALEYTKKAEKNFGFQKALYDGFCMFFLTMLDGPSAKFMNSMLLSYLLGGDLPPNVPFDRYLVNRGSFMSDAFSENYILTRSVKEHLMNLARAVLIKRYPVLLQGPTSSGKTSLVQYLSAITGHEFVRINNHEHTDLQEYLGSYITDCCGKLVFQEGVLVKAVRSGYWIVLDELNLAPSDVLEALNRLLDDNRELFVPELQETVTAHPDFMLFATQNPPTFYGGRKMLSRAFRNRFVEIHVDEIPEDELGTILEKRCKIPGSYAKKMVDVMKDLQVHRQSSKVFAGKHGYITPRDLFRWADRFRTFGISYKDLAKDAYFLLAERLRDENEKEVVEDILKRHLSDELVKDDLYMQEPAGGHTVLGFCKYSGVSESLGNIVWTRSMWRLYFLVERCYKMREPVLLVGETGGGKTTVCQLLSIVLGSKLHILNCHQYTETSDFLGGFYPVRERSKLTEDFKHLVEQLFQSKIFLHSPGDIKISSDISQASSSLDQLTVVINSYRQGLVFHPDVTLSDLDTLEKLKLALVELHRKWQTIFMWQDGPLVQAMKEGNLLLVDEISLADDSVLERLNSVLESERKLSLAEKGGSVLEEITAHPNFFLLATMNPGGDYGKKELSPALRNRFTEIWVSSVSDVNELRSIAMQRFVKSELLYIIDPMLNFWEWFNQLQTGRMLTVRDLLSWVDFINVTEGSLGSNYAFIHGAFLVLLDGLSLGSSISTKYAGELRERCLSFLLGQLKMVNTGSIDSHLTDMESYGWADLGNTADALCDNNVQSNNVFGIDPFYITKGNEEAKPEGFEFLAPTTRRNTLRLLRAMQLAKPVLLEGSPGVGKTSLIVALGKFSGHKVVRINLSEQTDVMDLLGSDLPVECEEGMKFAWSDGILLQALKSGSWVLLDELNLAPQSVLEGLNAILDHRAEVFIPELGRTFKCPPSFRVFACQNPSSQGGGRKGLPKSFLNRFTKVYVDELVGNDYLFIGSSLFPNIPRVLLSKLILFNKRLYEDTMLYEKYGQDGSPWEFNLRDVIRSCQIIEGVPENLQVDCFLNIIYIQRMRTAADRREVIQLYEEVFGLKPSINPYPRVQINPQRLIVGNAAMDRNHFQPSKISESQLSILPGIRNSLEATLQCVQNQWLCILVGPSSCGKTSLVRLLAELTGNVLNELNLSSATDISELIGCFEQYNAFRNFRTVIAQVEHYISEYCSLNLESLMQSFLIERKNLITQWLAFLCDINCSSLSSFTYSDFERWNRESSSLLGSLIEIIEQLKLDLEKYQLPLSCSCKQLDQSLEMVSNLQKSHRRQPSLAKFEWVTGLLVKAIENGEWIVLENANLCNPTVLDRINSLVEPSGSITINERGLVDDQPMVLHPHHKFRMFLTVNPKHGEVSRAMRNRGVEIFMMPPDWLLDWKSGYECEGTELRDVKRFLVLSGVPVGGLVDAMAEAHNYARVAALSLGVHITLLELTRWVQLFQQLLMNGNRPVWSLQLSWEHTYLSSLGEAEGLEIVMHGKLSYLSASKLYKLDTLLGHSLSLPGGWPAPHKLRNFICYSKEACIKQNCFYLEFLGTQCASYELSIDRNRCLMELSLTSVGHIGTNLLIDGKQIAPSVIAFQMLQNILFPTDSNQLSVKHAKPEVFDLELVNKMLLFAAKWTIEQATETDLNLYVCWFNWYSSLLEPYCHFFRSFLNLLEQLINHPIWNCIIDCRRNLSSHFQIDLNTQPLPILSLKLVELTASNEALQTFSRRLSNAIQCISLLQLSFQQWNTEGEYCHTDETRCFVPVLVALRELETEVLDILVGSPSFNLLFQLSTNLLEDHTLFWKGITSFQVEYLLISWRSLKKDVLRLQDFFPKAVNNVLVESRTLGRVSSWGFHPPKSMLWIHGGHPFLPSSADVYSKLQQLLCFCESAWPVKTKSWKKDPSGNKFTVEAVVSSNKELRFLAMQGVCMSSYLTSKNDQSDIHIVQQLEEMYQMLLGRFEHEKQKLVSILLSDEHAFAVEISSACCSFCPEILCRKSGFSSWQEILPIIDRMSFFLDLELLEELSKIVVFDATEQYQGLSYASKLVEFALNFSLNYSSRPPTDFLPHQRILWTLDAWTSVDSVSRKVASFVLEMWFRWHSSLWIHCPQPANIDGCYVPQPCMLFQPIETTTIDQILCSTLSIRDFPVHCLKLRVASGNLWQSSLPQTEISTFLLSTAHSLFQQIIFAHRKSFEEDKFSMIKSILCSIQENTITEDNIHTLCSLIASSSYNRLTSLIDSFVDPLLRELWQYSSHGFLYNLGCAWFHIGGLRFHLLLNSDDIDPAIKYSLKLSQLVEKVALLEREIEVRRECEHLAGRLSMEDEQKQITQALEKLELEKRTLQRKIVFRPDPAKFRKLKSECDDFMRLLTSAVVLVKNLRTINSQQLIDHACNWQETATCFINRLSDEYIAYIDIIQPVQVAVFEMKLGMSLAVSSAFQKAFVNKVGEDNFGHILETICSFMRFPRSCVARSIPVEANLPEVPCCEPDRSANIWSMDMNLLKKLFTSSIHHIPDKTVSVLQLGASFYHNMLVQVTVEIANSLLIDKTSIGLLDEIFDQFASMWMDMKVQTKAKEDEEVQQYKFRPRAFKIEDILEVDISSLKNSFLNESLCAEWQEMVAEERTETVPTKEHENLEEEWDHVQESIWMDMIQIHNQLFGSVDLVKKPGVIQVSDAERLLSFMDSYRLGTGVLREFHGMFSSSLDSKLVPEHLLFLCLEHDKKFGLSRKSDYVYNIYKDSNAPVMAKMVKPLTNIQQRILSLLNEWPDHPALQKILAITEMLLSIPLSTPLTKVLSGLQFLLSRAWVLQENGSKFSLSDQLEPIFSLMSSWQRMEFDSWPALLDGVQEQYEINAAKLWFPLYSVLHRGHSADIAGDNQSTIESLEEFIQTSSIGEFKKRLQLLFAFHGQINTRICLKCYSSPCMMEHLKILYNVFGYYAQFQPIISEHIDANRRNIETELKELLKLSRWEHCESHLLIETSKRTRQKLRKLIQKYNDVLQEPVMAFLTQKATQGGFKTPPTPGRKMFSDISDKYGAIVTAGVDLTQFSSMDRPKWYTDWRKKVDFVQNLHPSDLPHLSFEDTKLGEILLRESLASRSSLMYEEELTGVWHSLEKICRTATECAELWKDESKSFGKRRALSDLLKLLESCGLSRHKSVIFEADLKSEQTSRWFLQPSYDSQHLLFTQSEVSSENVNSTASFKFLPIEDSNSSWKIANQYYYKGIASVKLLRQICLNFHKDFSLEQVNSSASFLDHLIAIQQEQRSVAYSFAGHLKSLRRCMCSLKYLDTKSTIADNGSGNECFLSPNQHAMQNCLWQQKQLFDSLCTMLYEVSLLLRTVDNTHSNACQGTKVAVNSFLLFIERSIPDFQKSKESLDHYLLGGNGSVTTPAASLPPFIISRQMEELAMQNFQVINAFEGHVRAFCSYAVEGRSVKEVLLSRFGDIFNKAKVVMEEFHSVLDPRYRSIGAYEDGTSFMEAFIQLDAAFAESFKKTYKMIMEAFENFGLLSNDYILAEGSSGSLTLWKTLFESPTMNLRLDLICDELAKTISHGGKLVNHAGHRFPNLCSQVGMYFNHLHGFLDLICGFGDAFLLDFLVMHRVVAEMTHMLANLFASLYSEGFGTSAEEQEADTQGDISKNASGTGMGEGAGLKDVSDQINDEDQLLGTSEKPDEELDASKEVPSKNEKGIEMNEDFSADTYSVSEDSGDDGNEDDEDEKLESAMGETGEKGQVVNEKLWDKDEDGNPDNTNEKYESGPSVRDMDSSCRELHAREDDAIMGDEFSEQMADEIDKQKDEDENLDVPDNNDNMDDMEIDKETAYADPTGLQLAEQKKSFEEENNTEVPEGSETLEEEDSEECNDTTEDADPENGKDNPMVEDMDMVKTEGIDENVENDDTMEDNYESAEVDMVGQSKDAFEPGKTDLVSHHVFNPESVTQPNSNAQTADVSAGVAEAQWSNSNDMQNGIAPSSSKPSSDIPELEITVPDAAKCGNLTGDQPRTQFPQPDTPTLQQMQPNPCRSVGDALEEWKARVRASVDIQEDDKEVPQDMEDENANEYGFVSELEKGTDQTLGPATSDQIERNINNNKPNGDESLEQKDDLPLMETERQDSESHPVMSYNAPDLRQKIDEKMHKSGFNDESPVEGLAGGDDQGDDDPGSQSGSLVSINRSYLSEHMLQLSNLSVTDEEIGRGEKLDEVLDGMNNDATVLWRRYELHTTRLSQELAEQLRLVMEPTLASKLQGDYKTGKRINMKKVIPYIASYYRKDKIWLRRTRPNKRDYQVVVAVDDSRSMSESRCGDIAIEALVTVCRAMSQLEVGKLAVASFGKKGNVKLLHNFDHPFTGEAGVKMISQLTFKQENTIADEPVVDLLKYLNNMLDAAVENARLPSGKNPLQQLILIIADGRFHEKENLKRCVRDVLNKKRMVAFLLLDSPEESIMELQEASFKGDKFTITKYLDSFPFPYYIILKNIEELPRTLADLLRQWFELMQNTRDQ